MTAEFAAPRLPVRTRVMADTALTADALGLDPGDIGNATAGTPEVWEAGPSYLLVPFGSVDALGHARPTGSDWDRLSDHAGTISAWLFASDQEGGFRARMFSPAGGTPEDPATGSAVVTFAGLLALHGHCSGDETRVRILQGVEMGRRSEIHARIMSKGEILSAVHIAGSAVPISSGRIRLP